MELRKVINAANGKVIAEVENSAVWYERQDYWRLAKDESEVMPELRKKWATALAVNNDPLYVVEIGD